MRDVNIPYSIWEEDEFRIKKISSKKQNSKIIIVPEMRVCHEDTFQKLIEYAENGWTIFATLDSFYYKPVDSKEPQRAISQRMRELFQLQGQSDAETKRFNVAELFFPNTRFSWLTKGLPARLAYSDTSMLGVIGQSNVLSRHGDMHCIELLKKEGERETQKNENMFPAFLIREFDEGGLFIYTCFALRKIENYKRVLKNLYEYQFPQKSVSRQLRLLKIIIVILSAFSGFLLAKELLGGSLINYLGGAILGLVLGYLGNKITDFADAWLAG